jgi:hypothetical protein
MDEMLRYASLAGAGLPAHERHRAKSATVHQLRRVLVEVDGSPHFAASHPCQAHHDLAVRSGPARPADDRRRHDQALRRAAGTGNCTPAHGPTSVVPAVPGRTRKLILLAY